MRHANLQTPIRLNAGPDIPRIGLGTWKMPNDNTCTQAVLWALEAGYRLIDTASVYGNEEAVGMALKQTAVPRGEIFLTTKVWNDDQGYESTLQAIDRSLERLGQDYVDLYLIHWPCLNLGNPDATENRRAETWKAMEEILASGKARAIGVSNYTIKHLEEMKTYMKTPPAVNQIEFHPFWFRKDLMEYCHKHSIVIENYSPLARGKKLQHPQIAAIAKKHGRTNAQILLRWGLQHGNIVIPKSTNRDRIYENIALSDFALDDADMAVLDGLDEGKSLIMSAVGKIAYSGFFRKFLQRLGLL